MAERSALVVRIRRAGDSAVTAQFEPLIDPAVNASAVDMAARLRGMALGGVRDVVPAYRAVTVYFDPLRTDLDRLVGAMETVSRSLSTGHAAAGGSREVLVPVHYGEANGPDLIDVARYAGCSEEEVIRRHTARTYRVYMLGFLPGFAYMGVVDERIAMPRRDTPRTSVPAGSVGIAGPQTGIYPLDAPGGWRLIGRSSIRAFDPDRDEPFLFKPGDRVRFEPVPAGPANSRAPEAEGRS
jgi:KipI family sensor histidine kinase inhibitor